MILIDSETTGSVLSSRLSIGTEDGGRYRVYPTGSHWVLIKSGMAADVLAKLCRRDQGVEKAIEKAHKYIRENE